MNIEIETVNTYPKPSHFVYLFNAQVNFSQDPTTTNATVQYELLDIDSHLVSAGNVIITNAQYVLWSTDDNYLFNCCLTNLSLVRKILNSIVLSPIVTV